MKIQKYSGSHNMTSRIRPDSEIKFIVIHYTAGMSANNGTAKSICSMFDRSTTQASADYVVDKGSIWQYNTKPHKQYCWSVGGSKYPTMSTSEGGTFYGICTNSNSISIEMCSEKKNKKSASVTDKDWYIPSKVRRHTIWLTRKLMKRYGISASHVIMHHHVTGKWCPQPWCYDESRLKQWRKFKRAIKSPVSLAR